MINPPVEKEFTLTPDQIDTFDFDTLFNEEAFRPAASSSISLLFWLPGECTVFITRAIEVLDDKEYPYRVTWDAEINSDAIHGSFGNVGGNGNEALRSAYDEWVDSRRADFGFACPLCGWRENFYLEVKLFVDFDADGIHGPDDSDVETHDEDRMDCRNCLFNGVVADYRATSLESIVHELKGEE